MKRRETWFWAIVIGGPVVAALSVFLGHGVTEPLRLLAPEQHGILVARLWRVLLAVVVGASLSVAGAVLQAVLRNPLAEPYVLGLSSGAALGTAGAILAGGLACSPFLLPASGFVGSIASLAVVYRLARVGRTTAPHTLVLAGVIWSSICGSALMFLVSQSSAEGLHAILWWFLGDLQVFDARLALAAGGIVAATLLVLSLFIRDLNAILLGDNLAGHVGLNAERTKTALLALASVMTAAAVCVSGLISFVGLTVPHAARALVGADHRRLLPAAACLGAGFLAVADGLGRMLIYPAEIPVGVITALVGGPFFLWVLRRKGMRMWL